MARIHLLELEDQSWFPSLLRDAGTAYLRLSGRLGGQTGGIAEKLAALMKRSGETQIVDLCSGGGGPIPNVVEHLAGEGIEAHALLTDLFPNAADFAHIRDGSAGRIDFVAEPVDATKVPDALPGVRTLINGLHHFQPEAARSILQSAVDAGRPVAAFEFVSRTPMAIIGILFAPLTVALLVPFLRPFRLAWIPLTYVLPLIPLFVLWDGLVSCLRVYSPHELRALVSGVRGGDRYEWDIGRARLGAPLPVTWCLGQPRLAEPRQA